MQDLDPKNFPLASTPTPSSLKRISFDLDGKQTIFREAEDASMAMEELEQENETLKSNGTVQTVQTFQDELQQREGSFGIQSQQSRTSHRPASPDSITEPSETVHRDHSRRASRRHDSPRVLPMTSTADDPATPGPALRSQRRRGLRLLASDLTEATSIADRSPFSPSRSRHASTPSTLHSHHQPAMNRSESGLGTRRTSLVSQPLANESFDSPSGSVPASQTSMENVAPTPPIQGDERQFVVPAPVRRKMSSIPSRLAAVDTSSSQDGSLPSPSLSPVTAAANLQNAGYFADVDSISEMIPRQDQERGENSRILPKTGPASRAYDFSNLENMEQSAPSADRSSGTNQPSISNIPSMVDFFEEIPDELKSYVMHQLLRRCPKQTLHIVANVVNPALKCDFVGILPPELSLQVLKYLDVKSLCRASQVSRRWRHIVNCDEQAWKDLFDADGLSLPPGELRRAISEGWGWQDPSGIDGWEQDISHHRSDSRSASDATVHSSLSLASPSINQKGVASVAARTTTTLRRPKRKAASKLSSRNKQAKRRDTSFELSAKSESNELWSRMSSAEGPYNAANAAAMAVPYPKIGLSSLKDLHLYKSLYRRHHLIRKNWMREEAKPRHIAFRAHDRHVVTCLGFDDDKIVTGSDDTNINVYDTKTGALRAKLRGHEGGVWALQYEGNVLVSGSTDRTVRVWDIDTGRQMQVFQGHTSTVRCLQILMPTKVGETSWGRAIMMPKCPLIIAGSRDSNLRVWRLPQKEDPEFFTTGSAHDDEECPYFVRVLTGHQHSVRAIAAHADTLVSGSYDCTVRVWKISTGETVHRLTGHTQKVYSVVLDHGRNRCISGSMDYLVKIWSLDTGSILYTLDGHSSLVGLLDLNAERLVSAAADSTLRIWDPENGQCKATLSAHTGAITCFQHDGQKVISGSDRTLKMWNIRTGDCVKDLLTDLSGVWQVKFNERRCVAAVQRDSMTYIEVSLAIDVRLFDILTDVLE
jgi:F-box and WD-40 domain protein CDC4